MGTCYSVQGKGNVRPYITVKPLSRDSPILQGDTDILDSSPTKADLELLPRSVLKNSPNWSPSSTPLFEKKVHRQVSFDLMSELVPPSSESPPSTSTRHHQQVIAAPNTSITTANDSDQGKANSAQTFPVC